LGISALLACNFITLISLIKKKINGVVNTKTSDGFENVALVRSVEKTKVLGEKLVPVLLYAP